MRYRLRHDSLLFTLFNLGAVHPRSKSFALPYHANTFHQRRDTPEGATKQEAELIPCLRD